MNLIKTKEENLISARDIFIDLGIKRDFSNWIKYSLDKAMLEEGKDFTTILAKTTLWDDTPTKNSIPFDLRVNKSLANSIKENQLKLK
jgi:phage anti-repressor protein